MHKNGVGNKTGPHSLILLLIGATTIIYLLAAREQPSVDIDPVNPQAYIVGSEGVLYCRGRGIPLPTLQWRRVDGLPLSPRHQEIREGYIRFLFLYLNH